MDMKCIFVGSGRIRLGFKYKCRVGYEKLNPRRTLYQEVPRSIEVCLFPLD